MKLQSKEEEEKLCIQEEEWKEARCKAEELWAKKKVASAAKFKTLMTSRKPKASFRGQFASPKITPHAKEREEATFEISNQEYLHSITNVKVDKMKTAHGFLGLKPIKDYTQKLWNGLEKCNSTVDHEPLEAVGQTETDSFFAS